MKTFSDDAYEFREARIVDGDKGAGGGVIGGLGEPDSMRKEGTGNWFGYEEWGIPCTKCDAFYPFLEMLVCPHIPQTPEHNHNHVHR